MEPVEDRKGFVAASGHRLRRWIAAGHPKLHRVLRAVKHALLDVGDHARVILSRRRRPARLYVLYLFAGRDGQAHPWAALQRILRRLVGVRVTVVRIDNFASGDEVRRVADDIYEIAGDNTFWEFSGWKRGIEFLGTLGARDGDVLFVNDAFLNRAAAGHDERFFRRLLSPIALATMEDFIGVVHDAGRLAGDHRILGHAASTWIQTHFFVLPYRLATELRWVYLTCEQVDAILPVRFAGRMFLDNDVLSEDLERFLGEWITARWHGAREPSAESWPLLRQKLTAILNERLLSVELAARGLQLDGSQGRQGT